MDYLYSYRPSTRSWSILRPSGIHRYLHSAALLDGVMLIFGGNTHNDTSQQSGDRCFAADTLAYDVGTNNTNVIHSLAWYDSHFTMRWLTKRNVESFYIFARTCNLGPNILYIHCIYRLAYKTCPMSYMLF